MFLLTLYYLQIILIFNNVLILKHSGICVNVFYVINNDLKYPAVVSVCACVRSIKTVKIFVK